MNLQSRLKINKLDYKMIGGFVLGMTATMPVVSIPVGTTDISLYSICFLFMIIYLGVRAFKTKIRVGKEKRKLLLWLTEGIFACLCGWFFLSNSAPEWASAAESYLTKIVLLLIFAILWCTDLEGRNLNIYVAQGFLCGCVLNCVWATIDAVGYYLTGMSINNIVFAGYIARHHIRYSSLSLILSNGLFRSGGFNADPAQLGFVAPIIVCYALFKKKYWLLGIAIASIVASASTTALVTSVIVIILNFRIGKIKKRLTGERMIFVAGGILLMGSLLIVYWNQINDIVTFAYTAFVDRLNNVYLNSPGHDVRVDYIRFVPLAMVQVLPYIFFGTGFGTASLGYVKDSYVLETIGMSHNKVYDMENTYIAYFFDTGIVGIILFVLIIQTIYKKYRLRISLNKTNDFYLTIWCFICSSAISLFFYHYILFAPQMLMITIALSNLDFEDMNDVKIFPIGENR